MSAEQNIYENLANDIGEVVSAAVKEALRQQGRSLTGRLLNSIDYNVKATINSAFIEFTLLDYGMILNYGVPPSRIPYSEGSGAKGSKYIDGLKAYAKLRFHVNDKTALSIAFAIARKHKKFGMPLDRKTGWIEKGIKESNDEVVELINDALSKLIQVMFVGAFVEVKKKGSDSLKIKYVDI
jgi:hypothetical protein